jgi:hypothetical protein
LTMYEKVCRIKGISANLKKNNRCSSGKVNSSRKETLKRKRKEKTALEGIAPTPGEISPEARTIPSTSRTFISAFGAANTTLVLVSRDIAGVYKNISSGTL